MKKTQPCFTFYLSEINADFILKAKTIALTDYFNSNFITRFNYDFKELPILNFVDKSKLYLIENESYFHKTNPVNGFIYPKNIDIATYFFNKSIDFLLNIFKTKDPHNYKKDKTRSNEVNIDSSEIYLIIKENIMKNFVKYKMYHNITQNYKNFDTLLLFKTFYKAPDDDLLFMIDTLKAPNLAFEYKKLLNLLIIHVISKRNSIAERALYNLPNIIDYENNIDYLQYIIESNKSLHLVEYFKENNKSLYLKLIKKHTKSQIENF